LIFFFTFFLQFRITLLHSVLFEDQSLQSLGIEITKNIQWIPFNSEITDAKFLRYSPLVMKETFPANLSFLFSFKGNQLRDDDFIQIVLYPQLESLNISLNSITKLPPNFLEVKTLKYLDLSFNAIEELPEQLGSSFFLFSVHCRLPFNGPVNNLFS